MTTNYNKQVEKEHYSFSTYMTKNRWISVWHQLNEVLKLNSKSTLEVGAGSGLLKVVAKNFGLDIKTLDIAEDLNPDYLASATNIPFKDCAFDTICCFQMLEHLPYENSLDALSEFNRVANKSIIISLPDAKMVYPISIRLPILGTKKFAITRPRIKAAKHKYNGQHYWEINKQGYLIKKVLKDFLKRLNRFKLVETFRVPENPYHRFFIYKA